MKRIYVAGAYSGTDVIAILNNMREGMRLATRVMLAGHAPFAPWLDYHFQLMLRDGERLSVEDYYRYSIAWLVVSDCMLLVPGWRDSTGTKKERARAITVLKIPVFEDFDECVAWADREVEK